MKTCRRTSLLMYNITHLPHGTALARTILARFATVFARFAAARALPRRQTTLVVLLVGAGLETGRSALGVGRTGLGQTPAGLRSALARLAGTVFARLSARFAPGPPGLEDGVEDAFVDAVEIDRRPAGRCHRGSRRSRGAIVLVVVGGAALPLARLAGPVFARFASARALPLARGETTVVVVDVGGGIGVGLTGRSVVGVVGAAAVAAQPADGANLGGLGAGRRRQEARRRGEEDGRGGDSHC